MRALGDGAGALEITERFARILLHRRGIVRIQRRKVRPRVRQIQLRRRAIEGHGAEDVQHLDDHVVVATRLSERDGTFGERGDGVIVGTREQDRDADAQRECSVRAIAAFLQKREQPIDDLVGVRIPPLEIRELGAPRLDAKARASTGFRYARGLRGGIEFAHGLGMVALTHRTRRADEMQLHVVGGPSVRRSFGD